MACYSRLAKYSMDMACILVWIVTFQALIFSTTPDGLLAIIRDWCPTYYACRLSTSSQVRTNLSGLVRVSSHVVSRHRIWSRSVF